MTDPSPSDLAAQQELGDTPVPRAITQLAEPHTPEFVWRNATGGLTFRFDDRYVKWSPRDSGMDLRAEASRLAWIAERHPAPKLLAQGEDEDGHWLVTRALPGTSAVASEWKASPRVAIQAMATGLRALHAIDIASVPPEWAAASWANQPLVDGRTRPETTHPVLIHGDACAPNTLIASDGTWAGNVDFGGLAVGDRWADLAIAGMSLRWNYGADLEHLLYEHYGIAPDPDRIAYYRRLWEVAA